MELLQWQNLMFLLPLLLAVLYLLVLGIGGHSDGHDVSVNHDATMHHDFGDSHDHGSEHDASHDSGIAKALSLLGVGRVPLSLVLLTLLILWGGAGLISNRLLGPDGTLISSVIAGVVALAGTRVLASGLGRIIATKSYHVTRDSLVGKRAEVTFRVTTTSGEARLRDESGTLRDVSVRIAAGAQEIAAGTEVVLDHYDRSLEVFLVKSPTSNTTLH